ncbi:unnamed protein product, partial [marine sediment metagenome]
GSASTAAFGYTAGDVSTNLADCTDAGGDLDTPGAWTDIIDYDVGEPIKVIVLPYNANSTIHFEVDTVEGAGEGIRAQILIDGVIVWNEKALRDGAGNAISRVFGPLTNSETEANATWKTFEFECKSSFLLRASRNGTFADAATVAYVGTSYYIGYQ